VCHGVVVIRSLIWPGAFTLYQDGKQKSIYVGEGAKFCDKKRPFPLSPPILNLDPEEYGEFVLPEIKVFTPEDISAKVTECFEDLWAKADGEGEGAISKDDLKAMAGELKARLHGKDEPMEINEAEFKTAVTSEEDTVKKEDALAMFKSKLASL